MENNELYHWGIKGQKWGIRRFQNSDGSLTPDGRTRYGSGDGKSGSGTSTKGSTKKKVSRKVRKQREKALEKARQAKAEKREQEKTLEEKRAHLLKSTDAKELYENRHLLTTAELNDRINRIDMEARLNSKIVIEQKQTGLDYVNSKMSKASSTINNATNFFKSVDNAYSSVTNSAIGKTLAKKLGLEPPKQQFDAAALWKNRNKLTNKEFQDYVQRLSNEERAYDIFNKRENRAKKAYEKNAKDKKAAEEANTDRSDNKSSDDKQNTKQKSTKSDEPKVERYEATGDDVFGEGTSKFSGWNNSSSKSNKSSRVDDIIDADHWTEETVSNLPATTTSRGENYVSGLLEDWTK